MNRGRAPHRLRTAGTLLALTASLMLAGCASDDVSGEGQDPDAPEVAGPLEDPEDTFIGISEDRILFGQSAAFSGPARELGINMRLGILAAFNEANEHGGVHGRLLELQSLDDAYEPEDAIVMTRNLIEQQQRVRSHRCGRHTDIALSDPDRARRRGPLHRSLHRGRLPPRQRMGKHHQPARLLRPRDRGDGRQAHQ